ncbi:DoxX-like family protein [Lysinibacillus cavernae]|uniref:DoxX-like family protein n=1 Tax=Lysinibacillus cavernae TaxID=2666135 RepID=UPI0012D8F81C|nr:DoxX-like family protein [Lysinibacillus cavernae]
MKRKPIYVEVEIQAPIDEAWAYTQNPKLHEQWDLRFTSITYIPKKEPEEPQRFTYVTKIMPGLQVSGWGESKGEHHKENGTKTSTLHFGTPQKISPIAEGKGYWQYIPNNEGLTFLTQYDYQTRYGRLGAFMDLFFRPLMGWATALSFDVLKRWLETGENPAAQYRRFFLTMLISILFSFVWFYHGLVPKIIVQHPQEIMMTASFFSHADQMVVWIGFAEIFFALCWLYPRGKRLLFGMQIIFFPLLTLGAIVANQSSVIAPFNPLTFNSSLWVLSIIGFIFSKDLPSAKSCRRERGQRK